MSRVGKQPVKLPEGVKARVEDGAVHLAGKLGELRHAIPDGVRVEAQEGALVVTRERDEKRVRALHGLTRALLENHVRGVSEGYEKQLEIVGVSYQASLSGRELVLKLGYANDRVLAVPEGVTVELPRPTLVVVKGVDKQKVGQFAAQVRASRPPEPYKGKGVRYVGERIVRKQGKSFVGSE